MLDSSLINVNNTSKIVFDQEKGTKQNHVGKSCLDKHFMEFDG